MTDLHFIATEPDEWVHGADIIHTYRTNASLSRVKRYCAALGLSLVAYGVMQVFEDSEYLSGDDMRMRVREKAKAKRARHRERARRDVLSDDERKRELRAKLDAMAPMERMMWSLDQQVIFGLTRPDYKVNESIAVHRIAGDAVIEFPCGCLVPYQPNVDGEMCIHGYGYSVSNWPATALQAEPK